MYCLGRIAKAAKAERIADNPADRAVAVDQIHLEHRQDQPLGKLGCHFVPPLPGWVSRIDERDSYE
jgi:hypothetical protein